MNVLLTRQLFRIPITCVVLSRLCALDIPPQGVEFEIRTFE